MGSAGELATGADGGLDAESFAQGTTVPAKSFAGTIIQAAPYIERGAGVAGVAFNLEGALRGSGIRTERFTLRNAYGGWIPRPAGGMARKAALLVEVIWFSLVGGWLFRRLLAERDDVVGICHNDALAGDIYVNHGVLKAAMKARGNFIKRVARNPLHPFVLARDYVRYGSSIHRVVVALTNGEKETLLAAYPRLRSEVVVIPNGVDIERFSAAYDPPARIRTRSEFGISLDDSVVVFVGHEYERKGLPELLTALTRCSPRMRLLVVGGSPGMVASAKLDAQRLGVGGRVHFAGQVEDPRPYFAAGDIFCLPSAYEANALVILEALAMGLPVVATPVGFARDIVVDGENGYLIKRTPAAIAQGLTQIVERPDHAWSTCARRTGEANSWSTVAERYVELVSRLVRTDQRDISTT